MARGLFRKAGTAAGDLSAWMQSMDAHVTEIGELRREMRLGFAKQDERFARVDGRIDTAQERMEKVIEHGLREQTRFFFLAWSVILAAIIGLYART
jgi:hypothetical protein